MLHIMAGLPNNVLGVDAEDQITGADYETVCIPAVEEKFKTHKKLRLHCQPGHDFTGFDAAAMADDAKLGMKHLSSWEKVVLVSDQHLVNSFARFFPYLIS